MESKHIFIEWMHNGFHVALGASFTRHNGEVFWGILTSNHCAKFTCPFMQIMKTIRVWNVMGTYYSVCFIGSLESFVSPVL